MPTDEPKPRQSTGVRLLMRKRPLPYDADVARRHISKRDAVMRAIVKLCGPFELEARGKPYESLLRAILYQQLAGPAAAAIERRFLDLFGGGIPTPAQLADLDDAKFRSAGVSRQKMGYMRSLAQEFASGRLSDRTIARAPDDEVIEMVTQVKGIGRWTADMLLMFCMGRPDVLPVGDLGIRSSMMKAYGLAELPKPSEMEEIAHPWRPYRSAGTWYLWRRGDIVTM
jgi:DNA-3-methyladenine glycosylase II